MKNMKCLFLAMRAFLRHYNKVFVINVFLSHILDQILAFKFEEHQSISLMLNHMLIN
jgi:hypothetical protein